MVSREKLYEIFVREREFLKAMTNLKIVNIYSMDENIPPRSILVTRFWPVDGVLTIQRINYSHIWEGSVVFSDPRNCWDDKSLLDDKKWAEEVATIVSDPDMFLGRGCLVRPFWAVLEKPICIIDEEYQLKARLNNNRLRDFVPGLRREEARR